MESVYSILDVLLVLFFLIIVRTYIDSFKLQDYKPGKKAIPAWIFFVSFQLGVVFTKAAYPQVSFVAAFAAAIYLCKMAGGVDLKVAIFKGIFFCALWNAVEGCVYFSMSFLKVLDYPYSFMLSSLISKLLMYFVVELLLLKRNMPRYASIPLGQWLSLLSLPLSHTFILVYIYSQIQQQWKSNIVLILVILLMLLSNFLVFETYNRLGEQAQTERENLLYVQQLDLCNQQAMEREAAYQETQRVRHDLKNYLWDIRFSLENGQTKEAQRKIDLILEKNEIYKNEVAKTGNLVLDSLINYRYAAARALYISMECRIEVPGELSFDGADLSIILGNLMDNAMEAVKKLPEEERYIEVSMEMIKGSLAIMVKNPFEGSILKGNNGELLTSKKDKKNHGIGLSSVRHAAAKYNGELILKYDNPIFYAEVLLYPPKEAV